MNYTFANRFLLFLCGTMLLTTGCDSNSDDSDNTSSTDQIETLADLKALFDKGDITHVDFKTVEERNILDETIIRMEIKSSTSVFDFELLEIVTSPSGRPLEEDITSITFSEKAEPVIAANDTPVGLWSEVVISIHGNEQADFKPRAHLFDSEITTPGLVLLGDKLQMKFKKK